MSSRPIKSNFTASEKSGANKYMNQANNHQNQFEQVDEQLQISEDPSPSQSPQSSHRHYQKRKNMPNQTQSIDLDDPSPQNQENERNNQDLQSESLIQQYNQLQFSDQMRIEYDNSSGSGGERELSHDKLKYLGVDQWPKQWTKSQAQIQEQTEQPGKRRQADGSGYTKNTRNTKNTRTNINMKQDSKTDGNSYKQTKNLPNMSSYLYEESAMPIPQYAPIDAKDLYSRKNRKKYDLPEHEHSHYQKNNNRMKEYSLPQKQAFNFNVDSFLNSRPSNRTNLNEKSNRDKFARKQHKQQRAQDGQDERYKYNSNILQPHKQHPAQAQRNKSRQGHSRQRSYPQVNPHRNSSQWHHKISRQQKNHQREQQMQQCQAQNDRIRHFIQQQYRQQSRYQQQDLSYLHAQIHRKYRNKHGIGNSSMYEHVDSQQQQQSITLITIPQPVEQAPKHKKQNRRQALQPQIPIPSSNTNNSSLDANNQLRFHQAKLSFMDAFLPQEMKIRGNLWNFWNYVRQKDQLHQRIFSNNNNSKGYFTKML